MHRRGLIEAKNGEQATKHITEDKVWALHLCIQAAHGEAIECRLLWLCGNTDYICVVTGPNQKQEANLCGLTFHSWDSHVTYSSVAVSFVMCGVAKIELPLTSTLLDYCI